MTAAVAIIQARIASSRLPGKVLFELGGRPLIAVMLERLRRARRLDSIVVATGEGSENDALESVVAERGFPVFRGPEDDVLARYAGAAAAHGADVVVRLTADCPLMDPEVVDLMVTARAERALDFCTNILPHTWPDGLDIAVFTRELLEAAAREATRPSDREHVVPWMWRESPLQGGTRFTAANITGDPDCSGHRWTVDEAADYVFMRAVAAALGPDRLVTAGFKDILALLERRPEIRALNAGLKRDSGYARSLARERRGQS